MDARPLCAATTRRAWAGLSLLLVPLLAGASYRTPNFSVEAATPEAAKSVGDHAERCRLAIAKAWLGREIPQWDSPCPIRVQLTAGEAGGETNFDFAGGRVSHQQIRVEGRLDRILASALPHEVTHTIFAAYYGGPMPRWADEGASLLSEDRREMVRHDNIVLNLLKRRSEMSLGQLFQQQDYPNDLMGFYGQGYSVSRFLVEIGGRPRFLQFVKEGMSLGWDSATRRHYGLANCRELDRAWRSWHRVAVIAQQGRPPELLVRAQNSELPEGRRVARKVAATQAGGGD
ncbi:MAG TPA: hypothetical protein VFT74_06620 [Isosphaeraceae bacterium]|nr:hypothetical protein [Isosphaeraceae bacterium]